jgi:hypothetical protein
MDPTYKPDYNFFRLMMGLPMIPPGTTREKHEEIMKKHQNERQEHEKYMEKIDPEEKWRSKTKYQQKRLYVIKEMTPELKNKYIKWAKDFDKDLFSYIKASSGELLYPVDNDLRILSKAYIDDISEHKRLWNEENIKTNWTNVPYGITQKEWDSFNDTGIIISYKNKPDEDCNTM